MKALICGISGQDGSYLAELALRHERAMRSSVPPRDAQTANYDNHVRLGIVGRVQLESCSA